MIHDPVKMAKIRDMLAKLIRLAGSPNENEAKLAMERAAEISAKYDIELAEIEASEEAKSEMVNMTVDGLRNKRTQNDLWEASLAGAVAETFDCTIVMSGWMNPWKIHFLGRHQDVLLSLHFFTFLREMINRMSKFLWKTLADQSVYNIGMTSKVSERLKELYARKTEIFRQENSLALVIRKKQDTEEFKKAEYPVLKNAPKFKFNGSREAYYKGLRDGENIPLSRPIAANPARGKIS